MKKISLIIFMFILSSCQMFKRKPVAGLSYYHSQWDRAVLLLREQNYDEAESTLKELYAAAQSEDPEFATRALFELGQISEKNGKWMQALSQFKECEVKKNYLPGFKAELELPARLAGLYATLGELKTSEIYAKRVELNLQAYLQQISTIQQKKWWAETYFRMGSFPVNYVNGENWIDFAKRFHSTSQYLVRSMEFADPIWSERSLELAQTFFKKSLEFIAVAPSDIEENSVLTASLVRDRINLLEEILIKIELYKPISLQNSRTAWLFYESVKDYKVQVKNQLYSIKDAVPVSRESQKRNALEREGILKNPSPSDIDNRENDPNL